jgi:dienelactone hydrolase
MLDTEWESRSNVAMPNVPTFQPGLALMSKLAKRPAPHRFQATSAASAKIWRGRVRKALHQRLIDAIPWDDCALRPKRIESVDRGDHIREKWVLQTAPELAMPVYILRQKIAKGPQPVVLAFHGHGYGAKDVVGLWEDGSERLTPEGYHKDFAIELCRRGFLVAVPEIACFGERTTDFSGIDRAIGQQAPSSCHHAAMTAFHLGGSVLGMRIRDGMRLVDWLLTRKDVDAKRIGAMGISGGGMHTLYSACLDERIQASVISGYVSDVRQSLLGVFHCPCNYIPGLADFGMMEDLLGLIAPRPVLVQAGDHDPIFPFSGVKDTVAKAKKIYATSGATGYPETEYFEGRHQIGGEPAYDFLRRHLGVNANGDG